MERMVMKCIANDEIAATDLCSAHFIASLGQLMPVGAAYESFRQ